MALKNKSSGRAARRYLVKGRVQGVGYRAFAQDVAESVGVRGWTRNLDDGSVEVYAAGTPGQLSEFAGYLWKGPHMSEVRHVDEKEAALEGCSDFRIRH